MLKRCQRLFADDCGMVHSVEYLFLMTVVTIGMIVGFSTYRDQLVQEFGDVGVALERLDQSYCYRVSGMGVNCDDPLGPGDSRYDDKPGDRPEDVAGEAPGSMVINEDLSLIGSEKDAFGAPVVGGENNPFGP